MHYHISTGVGIFNVFPSVVAASSVQRSQSTICSHCDYTYIHVHTLKYTNAHKRVNIKVCITCFSSYFRLRVLQTTALPVYVCEHLALALSHLDSLRHAGETNTNAIPGSRQRLSSLSLGLTCPHSLLLRRPHNANSPDNPVSSALPLIHINVSGGGSNVFFFFFASL